MGLIIEGILGIFQLIVSFCDVGLLSTLSESPICGCDFLWFNYELSVQRQPEIHLFAARFKEQHGDISGARAAYQHVHTGISPGLLEAIIKHANMEHRLVRLPD